jgi:hypothetical protein
MAEGAVNIGSPSMILEEKVTQLFRWPLREEVREARVLHLLAVHILKNFADMNLAMATPQGRSLE